MKKIKTVNNPNKGLESLAYSKYDIYKCECGLEFKVYHDLYGTKSGRGGCECGKCEVIIN